MKNVGYYNGEMGLQEEMKIPFLDRGTVFLTTGFYVAGFAETDGPCGFHASDPLTMQKNSKNRCHKKQQ